MDTIEKLNYIETELQNFVSSYDSKRKQYKLYSFALKIATVLFSATITVLLGLKGTQEWADTFSNIALGLGAAITVLSAIDAFFGLRSLWIQREIT